MIDQANAASTHGMACILGLFEEKPICPLIKVSNAAAEFQKILDHRGIVWNSPIGAPAHLQLGRAYAMQGNTAKARAPYNNFLTLWKEADSDIPLVKEAKAEYAKLQ